MKKNTTYDENNIKYINFSLPKTGSSCLNKYLESKLNKKVYHLHSIINKHGDRDIVDFFANINFKKLFDTDDASLHRSSDSIDAKELKIALKAVGIDLSNDMFYISIRNLNSSLKSYIKWSLMMPFTKLDDIILFNKNQKLYIDKKINDYIKIYKNYVNEILYLFNIDISKYFYDLNFTKCTHNNITIYNMSKMNIKKVNITEKNGLLKEQFKNKDTCKFLNNKFQYKKYISYNDIYNMSYDDISNLINKYVGTRTIR